MQDPHRETFHLTPSSIHGRRVLVVGMGASGAAVASFLVDQGAMVIVTDRASTPGAADRIPDLASGGVQFELGRHSPETFTGADAIVVSPGVPLYLEPIKRAREAGIPVMGELEFSARFMSKPVLAVTGTNGKTTTTALLGHLLETAGFRVAVGGNIGTPLAAIIPEAGEADALVVEVSSFQLDGIETFRPDISIILNITPDHLDRYDGMSAYADSKARIMMNQTPDNITILNGNDPEIRRISSTARVRKWFLHAGSGEEGGVFQDDRFLLRVEGQASMSFDLSCLGLPGIHNRENAAAASLAALALGADGDRIQEGLSTFQGLPHRITHAGTVGGVRFYNDSKATNIDAVAKALASFSEPVVLIMGGRNKGYRFASLAGAVKKHARAVIALGESASDILEDLGDQVPGRRGRDMNDAVAQAFALADSGDVVLLSPGCASFDMFENYAHRGDAFCNAVAALKTEYR